MRKRALYLCLIFCTLIIGTASAQFDYLNFYAGTVFFPKDLKLNADGVSQNSFAGYEQGIKAGVGVEKYFTDNIGLGANLDYQITSKSRYQFSQLKIDLQLKYSFLRYSTVSPYIFAGGNLAFFSIKQESYQDSIPQSGNDENNPNIPFYEINLRYPAQTLSFVPVPGFSVGGGLSIRVNEWFSIFGEYVFTYYLNKQSELLNKSFPSSNKTNLSNSTIQAGVKIDLY